jgi:hypothetical protein
MQESEDFDVMEDEPSEGDINMENENDEPEAAFQNGYVFCSRSFGLVMRFFCVLLRDAGDEKEKKKDSSRVPIVPPIVPPSMRKPIVNGRLGSKSFNGHKWRDLLSAAQKACREGDLDRLIAVLIETHLMWRAKTKGGVEFGTLRKKTVDLRKLKKWSKKSDAELLKAVGLDKADCEALMGLEMLESNIKHRIEVFCCEDICAFAEWPVVRAVATRLETWGPQSIIEIARALCSATTLRAPSWLRAAFKSFPFHQSLQPPKADKLNEVKKLAKAKDTTDAIEMVAQIAGDLDDKNDRAFYWALRLLSATQIKKPRKASKKSDDGKDAKKTKKPKTIKTTEALKGEPRGVKDWGTQFDTTKSEAVYLLWVWLYSRIKSLFGTVPDKAQHMRSCFHTLRRWFERHATGSKERMIFVFQAMLMIKHAKEVDWSPQRFTDLEAKIKVKTTAEAATLHDRNLAAIPPPIVLKSDKDKHTGDGGDGLDFALAIKLGNPNKKYHEVYGKYEADYLAAKKREREEQAASKGKGKTDKVKSKGEKRKREEEDDDEEDEEEEDVDGDQDMGDAADEKKAVKKTTKKNSTKAKKNKKPKTERKGPAPKPAKKKASMEELQKFAGAMAKFTTSGETKVLTSLEMTNILNMVQAQCTTAPWKQIVALDDHYVWKGPFFIKVGETKLRLERMFQRRQALLSIHYCYQPNLNIYLHDHGPDHGAALWLRIDALYEVPKSKWQTEPDEGGSGSFQPAKIQRIVHKSTGVVQASDLAPEDLLKSPKLAADVLLSLLIGFIMDPVWGDSAPWNRLVRLRDGLVVCVDYEEVRSSFDTEADVEMVDLKSNKTATEWMLELSATICARPKAISEASAAAYAKCIGQKDKYFEQEWAKMLASARKQQHVPISEKRVQQVQALLDAIAHVNNKPKGLVDFLRTTKQVHL